LGVMGSPAVGAQPEISFERHIWQILKKNCSECHGEVTQKSKLDTRQVRLLVQGGKSGAVIVPGKSAESLLFQRISKGEMPPAERPKLTAEQVALIGRWIDAGAPTDKPEKELRPEDETFVTPEDQKAWAFTPPKSAPIPAFSSTDRVRTPIDAFLLVPLREKKLGFSPDADRATLIRRATIDLIGLPPSPEEVDAFVTDTSTDAYERLIEHLLDSPHYGERWGRHWLDVAGYADSDGYTDADTVRPWSFRYRDYVIQAFNDDMPFDQFIIEQLAGDELIGWPGVPLSPENRTKLIATGFLRNAADGTAAGNVDKALASHQVIADTIKITTNSLLGLSVQCAQCHNHRYDPISQKDYYRIRAVLEPAYNTEKWRAPDARRISLMTDAEREQTRQIDAEAKVVQDEKSAFTQKHIDEIFAEEIVKVPEAEREAYTTAFKTAGGERTADQNKLLNKYPAANVHPGVIYQYRPKYPEEVKKYDQRIAEIRKDRPVEEFIQAMTEVPDQVPESRLFVRGDYGSPGHKMVPGVLSVLTDLDNPHAIAENAEKSKTTGRRLAFARWLTRPDHPLTTRVWVNRVWMHHVGEGIVKTPSDFGAMGEPPTHPELLDWLACRFVAEGWSVKQLHRLIMTSTAYRQSSQRRDAGVAADPDNHLLWRMRVRRLEGEALRDSVLAVSGKLNPKAGGPAVPVREDDHGRIVVGKENFVGAHNPGPMLEMNGEQYRRSVYMQVRRSMPLTLLKTFDAPVMETNCNRRSNSVTPMQALGLMNGDFAVHQAHYLAERVTREVGDHLDQQITRAYRLVLGRTPDDDERDQAREYISVQSEFMRATDAVGDLEKALKEQRDALEAAKAKLAAAVDGKPAKDDKKNADAKKTEPGKPAPQARALANFCHVLLNANEFLYVD